MSGEPRAWPPAQVDRLILLACEDRPQGRIQRHAAKMRARAEAVSRARKRAIARGIWAQRRERAA